MKTYNLNISEDESYLIYDALEEYLEKIINTKEDILKENINNLMDKILKVQVDNHI